MKIRLTGQPAEVSQAIISLRETGALDIIQTDGPYPNRGDSRMIRVYVEAQLRSDSGTIP